MLLAAVLSPWGNEMPRLKCYTENCFCLPGKMLNEIKGLVIGEPKYWLDIISVWRKLHGHEGETDDVSQENALALKRKSEEETNTTSKRQKMEQVRAVLSEECQVEAGETCGAPERMSSQECWIESKTSSEFPSKGSGENPAVNEKLSFSFRVSCRCSGVIAKILTSQVGWSGCVLKEFSKGEQRCVVCHFSCVFWNNKLM